MKWRVKASQVDHGAEMGTIYKYNPSFSKTKMIIQESKSVVQFSYLKSYSFNSVLIITYQFIQEFLIFNFYYMIKFLNSDNMT